MPLSVPDSPPRGVPAQRRDAAPLEGAREWVLNALGAHFANDNLALPELERRLTLAVGARDVAELEALVADLPPLDAPGREQAGVRIAEPGAEVARGVLVAAMGGTVRKGAWVVPRQLKVVAIMGGAHLDMRRAVLAPGVTEIDVFVVMGGVEIIVPPGVRVEATGMAVMGGFETDAGDVPSTNANAPVIRLSGLAFMAGVEAKVKRPNTKAFKAYRKALAKAKQQP